MRSNTRVEPCSIASMLGQQACIHGYTVCYWPASKLFEQMKLCKADGTYLRELTKIFKKRLLIVDDFGLEVLDTASRLILLEILEDRHGRASSPSVPSFPFLSGTRSSGTPPSQTPFATASCIPLTASS
jgi:DNA replication protein DnaC